MGWERGPAPQTLELQMLDSFGQRIYQLAAAALLNVDYQVYMARAQAELWRKVSVLAKRLPQDASDLPGHRSQGHRPGQASGASSL